MIVGVTGGIGSGKSLVTKIFQCLKVPVYDSDSRAKILMTTDGILVEQIKKEFGKLAYHGESVNREFLAKEVFSNEEKLKKLNALVHPRVGEDFFCWVRDHDGYPYLIKEAALMLEAGSHKNVDVLVVVSSPEELRIQRVLQRDRHRSREDVERIISNQMPEKEKMAKANHIIVNDEKQMLIPQVLELHQRFISTKKN